MTVSSLFKDAVKKIRLFIKRYLTGIIAVLIAVLANIFCYCLPKMFPGRELIRIDLPIDRSMPFIPFFVLFYIGAYVQWALYYILLAIGPKKTRYRYLTAEILGKLLCLICFFLIPTTIDRPDASGKGFFLWAIRMVYAIDTPVCLFPSLHCLQSWMCARHGFESGISRKWAWANVVFSIGVFASTVLVHQHLVLDIPAGILVAEAGLLVAGKTMLPCFFRTGTEFVTTRLKKLIGVILKKRPDPDMDEEEEDQHGGDPF